RSRSSTCPARPLLPSSRATARHRCPRPWTRPCDPPTVGVARSAELAPAASRAPRAPMRFVATHPSSARQEGGMRRRLACMLTLVGLGVTAPEAEAREAPPVRHETAAETLHRKGVHCMEVIERSACAIDNFEALL